MWGIPVPSRVQSSGLGWGKEIRSGSGVPADALGNLGDRYFDTAASRWYFKRIVGNFNGTDYVSGPPILGVVQNEAFSMECLFRADPSIGTFRFLVSNQESSQVPGMINIGINNPSTNFGSDHYGVGGRFLNNATPGTWHKMSYSGSHDGGKWLETIIVDSVSLYGESIGAFAAGNATRLGGLAIRQWLGQICNVKMSGNGTALEWRLNDGAGSSVSDATGNGKNGTLSDGSPANFWLQSWVPMDLL